MEDLRVFRVPAGFDRALGRDTARTRKNWDKLVSELSTAPHVMRGVPEESPYIRRFHHQSFLSQRQRGFCFPGETVIRLENKGGDFISNIKVGQEVLGHDNNKHQVTEVFKRFYTGPLYILNIKGIEHFLRLTEEHPIGVVESLKDDTITWKAACYVKPGDLVLRPYGDQTPDPKSDYRRHKFGTLHPVDEINIEAVTNKLVYNFGVASVNTYVANDCAVHNCGGSY